MKGNHSLSERVFLELKSDILNGRYEDGAELKENDIAARLGVSRTPVREALRQLEKEGLAEIYPNRRTHVRGITEKDVEDIYQIRARLEGLCAQMAVASINMEQQNTLEEIMLLSQFYLERNDVEHLLLMDGQFHETFYASCGSKILEHQLKDYHQYVRMARKNSIKRTERVKKSVEEHMEILEAIKNKDAQLADMLATQHILNAMKSIRIGMEQRGEKNG